MEGKAQIRSALSLATAMLLAGLAGCGGGTSAAADPGAAPAQTSPAPRTQGITLSTTAASATKVTLNWDGAAGSGDKIQVYRDGSLAAPAAAGANVAADTGLAPGTQYCYQLTAVSSTGGGSASSNQSCVTTAPLAGWDVHRIVQAPPLSLALDPQGLERLAYCSDVGVVYQEKQADGSWKITVVDAGAACFSAALAVGGDGSAYLLFLDQNSDTLKYANDAAGAWSIAAIPGADGAEFYRMTVDSGNHVHAAYLKFTGQVPDCYQIVYLSNATGSWQNAVVAEAQAFPDIAVDGSGAARIAYLGAQVADGSYPVHYLTDASGSWVDTVAAVSADPKSLVALAVDAAGHAHLVFKSGTSLDYADDLSGSWQTQQVDSFNAAGPDDDSYGAYDVSVALDSSGQAHLSYEDTSGNLKYAAPAGGAWNSVYVDVEGTQNELKIDAAGHAHIAYGNAQNLYSKLAVSP